MATAVHAGEQPVAAPAEPGPGTDRRIAAVSVGTGLAAALLFWVVHRTLIDDAYITMSYARNLAFDFHWGLISQEPANSATSPLFVMLVGAATAIVRNTMLGLAVVFVGAYVAFAGLVTRTALALRLPIASAVLAIALVMLNPLLLSVTGMETTLVAALLAGLVWSVVQRRPVLFGVLAGLCLLTRLDLVVFIVVLGVSSRAVRRRASVVVAAMIVVSGPWFLWSWVHFGSAIPDTFVIKTLQHGFGRYDFTNGPFFYMQREATATVVSFLAAVLGAVTLIGWLARRVRARDADDARLDPIVALGVGGIAYYAVYSALDIAPYSWYYGPVIVALSLFLALLLPQALGPRAPTTATRPRIRAATYLLVGAVLLAEGAVVVGNGLPWTGEAAVFGNWARTSDYERVGKQLRKIVGSKTVTSPGEIGTLAFYCRCAIVDAFSDRGRVVSKIEYRIARAEPVLGFALDVNFRNLDRSRLPRASDYSLVLQHARARGPNSWNVYSSFVGHARLVLQHSAADPSTVEALRRELTPSLPHGHALVLVGASTGVADDFPEALALTLARHHVRVRLDPGDKTPWAPHRHYRGEAVRQVLTFAGGGQIDKLLSEPGTRVVAYTGTGSWSRRVAVKAHIAQLGAQFRAGALSASAYYVEVLNEQRSLGIDLAVIAS